MSEIHANIVVEPTSLSITPTNNQLNITPEAIQLSVYTGGSGGTGTSNVGELLFNNVGVIGGVLNTSVANGALSFNNLSNLKIAGGNTGYFLQTDGSGTLTWAAGTANVSGNGTSAGSNNQIQLSDGTGNFKVGAGFNFDPSSNVLSVPGNVNATIFNGNFVGNGSQLTNIPAANVVGTVPSAFYAIDAGNASIANVVANAAQPNITSVGTLISLSVTGNISGGNISGSNVSGGNLVSANYVSGTLTTNAQPNITSVGTLTSLNVTGTTSIQQAKEKIVTSGAPTGTTNFDLLNSAIVLTTVNSSANFTLNFRGNSTVTLNSVMSNNESMTCTFINKNGTTPYYPTQLQVDGTNVTPVWSGTTGGPTPGTVNGRDMYTFNIMKTAANTYTLFASRTGFI